MVNEHEIWDGLTAAQQKALEAAYWGWLNDMSYAPSPPFRQAAAELAQRGFITSSDDDTYEIEVAGIELGRAVIAAGDKDARIAALEAALEVKQTALKKAWAFIEPMGTDVEFRTILRGYSQHSEFWEAWGIAYTWLSEETESRAGRHGG